MSQPANTYAKHEHLKLRSEIEALFVEGIRVFAGSFFLAYRVLPVTEHASPLRFGVSVPKKKFKLAADRNLIKRRLRESWRTQRHGLQELAVNQELNITIMAVYTAKRSASFRTIRSQMNEAIASLCVTLSAPKAEPALIEPASEIPAV